MTTTNTPNSFIATDWKAVFDVNQLSTLPSVWQKAGTMELVDKPNQQGQGYSVVGTLLLERPNQTPQRIYVKKQQNYTVWRWHHGWWRKRLLCEAEFDAYRAYHALSIPTLTPIYFGKSLEKNQERAILITVSLDDYTDINTWRDKTHPALQQRRCMIQQVATLIKTLHDKGWMHYSLYPKHIFVSTRLNDEPVRLIDLEKTRRFLWRNQAIQRDLGTLYRRAIATDWTHRDAWCFLKAYCHQDKKAAKQLWRKFRIKID